VVIRASSEATVGFAPGLEEISFDRRRVSFETSLPNSRLLEKVYHNHVVIYAEIFAEVEDESGSCSLGRVPFALQLRI
jgi:hypothetical protein